MKKLFNYTWALAALCTLAACSENDSTDGGTANVDPYNGRDVIAFSPNMNNGMTRADGNPEGFKEETKVVVRIKAQDGTNNSYRYTQAILTAAPEVTSSSCTQQCSSYGLMSNHSHLTYHESNQARFWDDAFGRKSKLEIYAVAVPKNKDYSATTRSEYEAKISDDILNQSNGSAVNENTNPNWYTIASESNTVKWSVSAKQTSNTRATEDLVYSNNIKEGTTGDKYKGRYHQVWNTASTPNDWEKSMESGRLAWQPKTDAENETTGKFDLGHLVFNHALSWITIVFKEGEGFNISSPSDFIWTNKGDNNQAIKLIGFPTKGELNVTTGEWSNKTTNVDITQMEETEGTYNDNEKGIINGKTRQLEGFVLPGTTLYNVATNVLEFEIDNAQYYVKGSQIANAIREYYKEGGVHADEPYAGEYRNFTETKAGKHYVINLTVGKKKIDEITAAVIEWETVNSTDATPQNTYCKFDFEDRQKRLVENDASKFQIYRAAKHPTNENTYILSENTEKNYDWKSGYSTDGAANKTWVDDTSTENKDHWTTGWFWENNKTYYHFRAIGETTTSQNVTFITDASTGDYFSIASGTLSGSNYKDYIWGAPFVKNNGAKIKYDTTSGFAGEEGHYQISSAIGATDDTIKIMMFHMTSKIKVNVRTTLGTPQADNVTLWQNNGNTDADKTKVEILRFLPTGTVFLGGGLVKETDGTRTSEAAMTYGAFHSKEGSEPDRVEGYSYGMVPQPLKYGTGDAAGTIGLRITTPDGNQYVVKDLSTCYATVTNNNLAIPYSTSKEVSGTTQYLIDRWYPNYEYTYTITIKKTGIQNITAAVIDWEKVTGDLGTIDLEN